MTVPFTELASVTREHFMPDLIDQLYKNNPFYDRMYTQNRIMIRGGDPIHFPVSYADLGTTTSFSKSEVLPTNPTEQITKGSLNWREYVTTINLPQFDLDVNSAGGDTQLLDYMETKMDLARRSLQDRLGVDLEATQSGKNLDGLGSVLIGASGTYAGLSTSDIADWRSKLVTIPGGLVVLYDIQKLIGKCTDGSDRPTLLLMRQSVWDRVWSLLQADQRFVRPERTGSAGFETLKVSGVDTMVDTHVDGSDGGTADNHLRCLNENYLNIFLAPWGNFKLEAVPNLKDQRVKIMRIYCALNLICRKLRVQGEIQTVDPDVD